MTPTAHANPSGPSAAFRPEIQGLRAIAVLAVLGFHLWPSGPLSGGYVGVDVFFVISGFLITGILLREFDATGTISITHFYARRIRRLLPAATLVMLAIAACLALFPASRWADIHHDIIASALYFQNWNLAARAVDYLASDGPQGPLEHFWSLSVEEQYYVIWPLLALLSVRITPAAARHPKAAFAIFIGTIGTFSLAYSVFITPREPGLAYFATTTRAWELALGGGLAVLRGWEKWPTSIRAALGPFGILLIAVACLTFTLRTSFPGYHALLPTLGTAMVIVCGGCGGRFAIQRLLALKPVQYLGDISYSLYLWHWPVIVIYKQLAGADIGWTDTLVIVAVSLSLAHQSKLYVEDRYRSRQPRSKLSKQAWKPFGLASACLACSLLAPVAMRLVLPKIPSAPIPELVGTDAIAAQFPGARVLTNHAIVAPDAGPYLPRPANAKDDHPSNSCHQNLTGTAVVTCHYGDPHTSSSHVVLLGDSHADQWLPAFRILAKKRGWYLTAMTKSACAFTRIDTDQFTTESNKSCAVWNHKVLSRLMKTRPDAVFISQSLFSLMHIEDKPTPQARKLVVQAMLKAWRRLASTGVTLYVIKDTPKPAGNVPDCLSTPSATISTCSQSRSKAFDHVDPLVLAARDMPQVHFLDLDNAICSPKQCRAVVGNVLVYRDTHHLTATYVRTVVAALSQSIGHIEPHSLPH